MSLLGASTRLGVILVCLCGVVVAAEAMQTHTYMQIIHKHRSDRLCFSASRVGPLGAGSSSCIVQTAGRRTYCCSGASLVPGMAVEVCSAQGRSHRSASCQFDRRQSLAEAGKVAVSFVLARPSAALGSSSNPAMTVLVAGATGRSGVEVVKELKKSGSYSPVCMIRSATSKVASGVQTFQCDVTSPNAQEKLVQMMRTYNISSVICTLGFIPTFVSADDLRASDSIDNKGTTVLIRAAEEAVIPGRFVLVSSLLTTQKNRNLSAQLLNSLGGVVDAKRQAEVALESSTLDYTILRPGVFSDKQFGNLIVGPSDRFVGEDADVGTLGGAVKCDSPFMARCICKNIRAVKYYPTVWCLRECLRQCYNCLRLCFNVLNTRKISLTCPESCKER